MIDLAKAVSRLLSTIFIHLLHLSKIINTIGWTLLKLACIDLYYFVDKLQSTGVILYIIIFHQSFSLLVQFPTLQKRFQTIKQLICFCFSHRLSILIIPTTFLPVFLRYFLVKETKSSNKFCAKYHIPNHYYYNQIQRRQATKSQNEIKKEARKQQKSSTFEIRNMKKSPHTKSYIFLLMMELRPFKENRKYSQIEQEKIRNSFTLKSSNAEKINKFLSILKELDNESISQIWAVQGDYSKSRLSSLIPYIQEWKLAKLYLWSNKKPMILNDIKNIRFNNLKELHLGWNNIESIQSICDLKMPDLKELVLRDNKITNVKSLKKSQFEKLEVLCLRGNFISQFNFFQWNFINLLQINLNDNFSINFATIMKGKFQKIKNLRAKSKTLPTSFSSELMVQTKLKFIENKTIGV